eukprot:gene9713-9872_t
MLQFSAKFQGVRLVTNIRRQVKAFENESALFYFHGREGIHLLLQHPKIVNVSLKVPPDGKDFSLLAFGGNIAVTVKGGQFSDNYAGSVLMAADKVVVDVQGTHVLRNKAKGGAALRMVGASNAIIEDGAAFTNNTATYGGAVYMQNTAQLSVAGSSITGNTAQSDVDKQAGQGGGVYAKENTSVVITKHSTVSNNTSPDGGGIKLENQAQCRITAGAVIAWNSATGDTGTGAGVFAQDSTSLNVSNAHIMNNHAKKQGGGIGLRDKSTVICSISGNSTITNNEAGMQGGGVYIGAGAQVTVLQGTQVAHNAAKNGAGLHMSAEDQKGYSQLNITGPNTNIVNNTALDGAGPAINVFATDDSDAQCQVVVRDGVTISHNSGTAAFVSNGQCDAKFEDVSFVNNSCDEESCVANLYQNATARFSRCVMSGSTGKRAGGVWLHGNAHADFFMCNLHHLVAYHAGGAVEVTENATAVFTSSAIHHCWATSGGAISIQDNGTVVLYNSSLTQNEAKSTGGAVNLLSTGTGLDAKKFGTPRVMLKDRSNCSNNTATFGGCISVIIRGYVLVDSNSLITSNTAQYGGGIKCTAPPLSRTVLTEKELRGNKARMFGNEKYVEWTKLELILVSAAVDTAELDDESLKKPGSVIQYVNRDGSAITNEDGTAKFLDLRPVKQALNRNYTLIIEHVTPAEAICTALVYRLFIRPCIKGEKYPLPCAGSGGGTATAWASRSNRPPVEARDAGQSPAGQLPADVTSAVTDAVVTEGWLPNGAWCGVLGMTIIFFFLTSMARAAVSLFLCYTLPGDPTAVSQGKMQPDLRTPLKLWLMDMNKECYSQTYKVWCLTLGACLTVLMYACLPILLTVVLYKHRQRLTEKWVQQHFGFLYVHYKPQRYLWEVVTVVQTLMVVVISMFADDLGVYAEAVLLHVLLAAILVVMVLFRPMASQKVQVLSYASLGVQLFTTYAVLSFIPRTQRPAGSAADADTLLPSLLQQDYKNYHEVMGWFVIVVNVAFIAGALLAVLMALPVALWRQRCRVALFRAWRSFRICTAGWWHPDTLS